MSNMNSIYNEFYISETSNVRTNNINEFKVSTITLVKIKNHEIVEALLLEFRLNCIFISFWC